MLRNCCLKQGGELRPVGAVTRTPAPTTGIRNKGCYAAAFADCSADISREHYVSHGLLKLLTIDGKIAIDGFPWQGGGTISSVSPAALTGKILCSRHNLALSPLDAVVSRLLQRIDQFHHEFIHSLRKHQNRFFLLNGHDIERWMLKTLCGAVASGNAEIRTEESNWRPPLEWLRILFGEEPFPPRCGLYFHSEVSDKPYIERGFKFVSFFNKIGGVYGARISLNDERFVLAMSAPPEDLSESFIRDHAYRPQGLRFMIDSCEKVVHFGWDDGLPHRGATIGYQTTDIGSQL
ncbi:MAG: hypothetical protein WCE23_01075 [Candidatus Binatus sp.]|uniref:hypothetical protein n=1 Tax=Candidatus Binatus sp. TaxID=2811406 RepID=UPI003C74CECF